MGIHRLRYSWGEPALDSPFPVSCHPFVLAVHVWMVTTPTDCSQTVAAHVELFLMVDVVMELIRIVPIARNVVVVCHWTECSLEVVSWAVGLWVSRQGWGDNLWAVW